MWPEVAGNEPGDKLRRRRVWDLDGNKARKHGEARAQAHWAPGSSKSSTVASGGGDVDHKDGHDLVGGEQGTEAATASYGTGKSTEREGEGGGGPALTSFAGKARGRVEVAGDGVGVRRPEADGG